MYDLVLAHFLVLGGLGGGLTIVLGFLGFRGVEKCTRVFATSLDETSTFFPLGFFFNGYFWERCFFVWAREGERVVYGFSGNPSCSNPEWVNLAQEIGGVNSFHFWKMLRFTKP